MKKFTTKQLAIAFVAIAFVFIFGFTAYRGITGQFQSQPTISKAVKSNIKKKDISKKVAEIIGSDDISNVYFTDYIIQ